MSIFSVPFVGGEYRANVERCMTGDTFDLLLDLGFKTRRVVRVHLDGVECPSPRKGTKWEQQRGLDAKRQVEEWILGKTVIASTDLVNDRWVAMITFYPQGPDGPASDLGLSLIENGLGRLIDP